MLSRFMAPTWCRHVRLTSSVDSVDGRLWGFTRPQCRCIWQTMRWNMPHQNQHWTLWRLYSYISNVDYDDYVHQVIQSDPFYPLVCRSLHLGKHHLTIPETTQRIARCMMYWYMYPPGTITNITYPCFGRRKKHLQRCPLKGDRDMFVPGTGEYPSESQSLS